jgi:hypothetical protein
MHLLNAFAYSYSAKLDDQYRGCSKMKEEVLFSKEVPESVALYITAHGGKVQTERVDPAHVFHKVTFLYKSYKYFGGAINQSPIYLYILADDAKLIVQFIHADGAVPGSPMSYWTTLYVYTEKEVKQNGTARTTTN